MNAAADQFVEVLAAAGVARIYGIVGDSLTDAIRRQGSPRHNSRTTSFAGPAGVRGPSGQPSLGVSSPDLGPRLIAGACFPGNHRRRPKTDLVGGWNANRLRNRESAMSDPTSKMIGDEATPADTARR
jgi:hypothetical protein